jgi:hypothetical protein
VKVALLLLGKPGCHLCDEMREVVLPVLQTAGLDLVERDVRDDPEMERRYLLEIPVLLYEGREVALHRTTAEALSTRLRELGVA